MRLDRLAIAILSLALMTSPLQAQLRVTCVGDSITYGVGVADRTADSYPSVLQRLLPSGSVVENDGHSGATMLQSGNPSYWDTTEYTRATAFATADPSTQIVIMLGANDTKPANWPAHHTEFMASVENMVAHFGALGRVWLVLPPPAWDNTHGIDGTIIHDEILPVLRAVAAALGVGLIDVYDALIDHMDYFMLDNIHPDEQGAALIAQTVADALLAPPPVDAGVTPDSGVAVDASTPADAGAVLDGGPRDGGSLPAPAGCSCSTAAGAHQIPQFCWAMVLLVTLARRRSHKTV